jgi:hypothetical protein
VLQKVYACYNPNFCAFVTLNCNELTCELCELCVLRCAVLLGSIVSQGNVDYCIMKPPYSLIFLGMLDTEVIVLRNFG